MGYNNYGGYNNNYGGYNNNYDNRRNDCDCDTFFRHVSRNQFVKVFLKASKPVEGFFIEANGKEATLFDFDRKCHSVITICCDDIVAVKVSHSNDDKQCDDDKKCKDHDQY
ncbi:hypothetical protein [Alkalihalobacillus pseudalcaliphilus]|uniref:hypothetical protein n=1 Tax=Alkalihalobacillus pseudalcaliphilus TaxID=79884 RepID=UPI00064DD2D2|nr:hypothetical protein [Alkalihalobacillus pseudalcaliphilus]KMK74789.1 hypothetical protein AB990_20115 [Alkalihalobacillus pseudalcaliphilus]